MVNNETIQVRRLHAAAADFDSQLTHLLAWDSVTNTQVAATVAEILQAVAEQGDEALLRYCRQLDGLSISQAAELEISPQRLQQALVSLDQESRQALETAANRIRVYHEHQQQSSWQYRETNGTVLGQRVMPLDRVGVYVPGGKASYPSSVLMNVIPARVAGVGEVIMAVPAPKGELNPLVLAAAAIAKVDRVFTIGGAQAIAALAFGTATIPKVDKIVGPGNIYVATAKQQVFGRVGLDMIAGPSEILIIGDGTTNPDWIAMDLFSQAEHDENAQALLVSPDAEFLSAVQASIKRLLPTMERAAIIRQSLASRGALIQVADLDQAIELANRIAPEHLELAIADPEAVLDKIRHAGAIFMGRHTAEALGDYCAGPSHVLPTSGTARFSSPLGVYDFQKRSSLIYCSRQGASELAKTAAILARGESLTAHARSAEYRLLGSGDASDQE